MVPWVEAAYDQPEEFGPVRQGYSGMECALALSLESFPFTVPSARLVVCTTEWYGSARGGP